MVILYGTEDCHLCELAEQILVEAGCLFAKVDIAELDDEGLYQSLELRIPVLEIRKTAKQLGWPFSLDDVRVFLK